MITREPKSLVIFAENLYFAEYLPKSAGNSTGKSRVSSSEREKWFLELLLIFGAFNILIYAK